MGGNVATGQGSDSGGYGVMRRHTHGYEFDSWTELMDVAENGADLAPDMGRASRNPRWDDWAGASWDGAVSMARRGWTEGAERIARQRDALYAHLVEIVNRKEVAYAQQGPGILNMKRYQQGHPAPYQVRRQTTDQIDAERSRGILRIGFNMGASSAVSSEVMFVRGAAIAALVDCLERAKFRVELDVADAASGNEGRRLYTTYTRIKNAEDHLEPDLLAFICAHSAALRRISFSVWETADPSIRRAFSFCDEGHYGTPARAFDGREYDIVLEQAHSGDERWHSEETAAAWVRGMLAAQGIEVAE